MKQKLCRTQKDVDKKRLRERMTKGLEKIEGKVKTNNLLHAVRFNITNDKTVSPFLLDVQSKCVKMLNYCMSQYYVHEQARIKWKRDNGKFPTKEQLPEPNLYREFRDMFPDISTYIVSMVLLEARRKFDSEKKDLFRLNRSLSTFKKSYPVPIHYGSIKYQKNSSGYIFECALFSGDAEYDTKRFPLILNTKKISPSQRYLLDGIFSKRIVSKSAKISCDKYGKKWYVTIAYQPPKKDNDLSRDIVVGVDLGSINMLYAASSSSPGRLCIDGKELTAYRNKIRSKRDSYRKNICISNRTGRGRKKALKPVENLSMKEANFIDTKHHKASKKLIEFAISERAGVIQMENLDSLKKGKCDTNLRNWNIGGLQSKVKYKAEAEGIRVVEVNAKYTSQRCSRCGYIDPENRKIQSLFQCVKCNFKTNADYNAAVNLTLLDIEEIIMSDLAKQKRADKCEEVCACS